MLIVVPSSVSRALLSGVLLSPLPIEIANVIYAKSAKTAATTGPDGQGSDSPQLPMTPLPMSMTIPCMTMVPKQLQALKC